MSYNEQALTQARNEVFNRLVNVTRSQAGKNAFCGLLPQVLNRWALFISGGRDTLPTNGTAPPPELWMSASIEGNFSTLEGAEAFVMAVLQIMPINEAGPVQCFRPTAMPGIEPVSIQLAGEAKAATAWNVIIPAEIVFATVEG